MCHTYSTATHLLNKSAFKLYTIWHLSSIVRIRFTFYYFKLPVVLELLFKSLSISKFIQFQIT